MSTTDAELLKLQAEFQEAKNAKEPDKEKVAGLKVKLVELCKAKLEAIQNPKPLYPEGAKATFGEKAATVLVAKLVSGQWCYTIEIDAGPLIPNFQKTGTEAQVKAQLAEQLGQRAGPAYPRGLTIQRNGWSATVQAVALRNGEWVYALAGHKDVLPERRVAALLRGDA